MAMYLFAFGLKVLLGVITIEKKKQKDGVMKVRRISVILTVRIQNSDLFMKIKNRKKCPIKIPVCCLVVDFRNLFLRFGLKLESFVGSQVYKSTNLTFSKAQ